MRVGEHNLDQNDGTEQDIQVKKVILHPKWDIGTTKTPNGVQISTKHDIALIQLSSPVKFTSNVNSMCLDNGQSFKAGEKSASPLILSLLVISINFKFVVVVVDFSKFTFRRTIFPNSVLSWLFIKVLVRSKNKICLVRKFTD